VIVLATALSACSASPPAAPTAAQDASVPFPPPEVTACYEVNFQNHIRGPVIAGEVIQSVKAREIVAIKGDVAAGATISLAGEGSCLYIDGNIGPNVTIGTIGEDSGVIITGDIDTSDSTLVQVLGPDSVLWAQTYVPGPNEPHISVNGQAGCKVFGKGGNLIGQ
jgi:hypothetical protein